MLKAASFFERLFCWLVVLLLSACVSVPKAPEVSLVGVALSGIGGAGPRLVLKLNVRNVDSRPLALTALDVNLELSGRHVAHGVLVRPATVPALGEAVLDLQVQDSPQFVWRQLREAHQGAPEKLDYRIFGSGELEGFGRLPFDRRGEIAPFLPAVFRKGASSDDKPL